MCGYDTLASHATDHTLLCHVIQAFVDRCAELGHVYKKIWRLRTECCECLAFVLCKVCFLVQNVNVVNLLYMQVAY